MKKRVIMTEGQVSWLRLLAESSNALEPIEWKMSELNRKIKSIWDKVSFISVADLPKEVKELKRYYEILDKYEKEYYVIGDEIEVILKQVEAAKGYDAMSDLDSYLDDKMWVINEKREKVADVVQSLISAAKINPATSFPKDTPKEIG